MLSLAPDRSLPDEILSKSSDPLPILETVDVDPVFDLLLGDQYPRTRHSQENARTSFLYTITM